MTGQEMYPTRTRQVDRPDMIFVALGMVVLGILAGTVLFFQPFSITVNVQEATATPEFDAGEPAQILEELAGPPEAPVGAPTRQSLADRMGIEIVAIHLTTAGRALDARYKVLDAQKAARMTERGTRAFLIDQDSGRRLPLPGPPRRASRGLLEGRTYSMIFHNPNPPLEKGRLVDLVIGDTSAYNLTLQ